MLHFKTASAQFFHFLPKTDTENLNRCMILRLRYYQSPEKLLTFLKTKTSQRQTILTRNRKWAWLGCVTGASIVFRGPSSGQWPCDRYAFLTLGIISVNFGIHFGNFVISLILTVRVLNLVFNTTNFYRNLSGRPGEFTDANVNVSILFQMLVTLQSRDILPF